MTSSHLTPDTAGTVFDDDSPEASRSYAEALVNAAANSGDADAVLEDLEAIVADVFRAQPKFASMLVGPSIRAPEKDRILTETFEGRTHPIVSRFLRVLNQHGRLNLLDTIVRQARANWDRRQNRRPVTVRTALPLDEGQLAALRDKLAAMIGATPIITAVVDPSLIGGLVVQVGDDLYDASIRSRLEQLRRGLVEGKSHDLQGRRDQLIATA